MTNTNEVVILGYARTPIGSFQGALSEVSAPELGAIASKEALKRAKVDAGDVSETIFGCVLPAGIGQAPARQAMLKAGIPSNTPAMTINKVCGSGMKAIMLATQSLKLGDSEVVLCGGMENMSQSPYYLQNGRKGFKMGNQNLIDGMIHDGLWDPYNNQHMGNCAETCAKEKDYSREKQDEYAIMSYERAIDAQKKGLFQDEIAAVEIKDRKGNVTTVSEDEGPKTVKFDKIPGLKPVFDKAGSVTAANASSLNDGAAALVLASSNYAKQKNLKPIAKVVSYGTHAQDPVWFTTAPKAAMESALKKANWKVSDVDLFEVNEAFAIVAMDAERELKIPREKLNVRGGAISLGHPIGASGARIVITLISALKEKGLKKGLAGICIGGGEATAIAVEML